MGLKNFKPSFFEKHNIESEKVIVPDEIYNYRIYLFAVIASFGAVISGYDTGFIGTSVVLESFKEEFGLDKLSAEEVTLINSNIISIFHVGAYFGALGIFPIGDRFGRRVGLLLAGFFMTFGSAIMLVSNSSRGLGGIYAGRVLTGVGVGFCSGITCMYIGEIAPASIRGHLTGLWEMSWQLGGLVGYWINYGVQKHVSNPYSQWMIPFAIQLIPSTIYWVGSFFLPESPRWLISKYKRDAAEKSLSFLTTLPPDHQYIQFELDTIEEARDIKREKYGEGIITQIKTVFTQQKYLRRLTLSTSLFVIQNSSGINAITYYSVTVLKSMGVTGSSAPLLSTGIFGALKIMATLLWMLFIVDKLGRRFAFIAGAIPCGFTMYFIGAYIKIADPASKVAEGNTEMTAGGKAALAMFYIWTISYGATINGTCWVYCAELFDQHVRTLVSAVNASSNWFWAFIFARFTGNMFEAMGYGVFFLFAGCMTLTPFITYLVIPETKGVPLEAVDYLFEVPAWRGRQHALEKYKENIDDNSSKSEKDLGIEELSTGLEKPSASHVE